MGKRIPSLIKKYLMALSGLVLVGFVLSHMLGNLLMFAGPDAINAYAYQLKSLGAGLWVFRLILLGAVGIHVWMAILLVKENRAARPERYKADNTVQASYSSRVMPMTGLILLSFIIFHILHFTAQITHPEYQDLKTTLDGNVVHDVYTMVAIGFSPAHWYVSLFYIISVGLLCSHLSHGVSSMFQSLGLRNEQWRYRLDKLAKAYGWLIFIGFASIPVAGLLGAFDTATITALLQNK